MAQRYSAPIAHERMAANTCPECGDFAEQHVNDNRFWLPRRCDLMPQGVNERIAQYRSDTGVSR